MSDWVVIAWKNQPGDTKRRFFFKHNRDIHAHYTPLKIARHIPMEYVVFVAQTSIGRVPVFDAGRIGEPLKLLKQNLNNNTYRSLFGGKSQATSKKRLHFYVVKPYEWLQDQFGVEAIHANNIIPSPFYTPPT